MSKQLGHEFSRPVVVDELEPGREFCQIIEADDLERQAVAARLGIVELKGLMADVVLRQVAVGPLFMVKGRIVAEVVQNCIVTGALIENRIEENIDEKFAPDGYEPPDIDNDDLPESFDGANIDIGEMAVQLLSLSLDPYPLAADTKPELFTSGEPAETERRRPFEGLADMLKNRTN
jgi:hypothetical protein